MNRLAEVLLYKLTPGQTGEFHRVVHEQSVPLLRAWGTDVVAYGPSAGEPDGYFLIRRYLDRNDLEARQSAFYASEAWRSGPREAIVSRIVSHLRTLLWLSEESIETLRGLSLTASSEGASPAERCNRPSWRFGLVRSGGHDPGRMRLLISPVA